MLFYYTPSFSQNTLIFIESFQQNEKIFENKIIINDDFAKFQNSEISITLSTNNEILDIQYLPLGVKWSGSLNSFQKEYTEYVKIKTENLYRKINKSILEKRAKLLQNNDAIILNDSIKSFKQTYNSCNILKIKKDGKILNIPVTKFKTTKSCSTVAEIWFGKNLKKKNIEALYNLNMVLQKFSIAINKTYSVNLNYVNKTKLQFFPIKTIEYDSNYIMHISETTIAFNKIETTNLKCHPNNNYQIISLFDLFIETEKERTK